MRLLDYRDYCDYLDYRDYLNYLDYHDYPDYLDYRDHPDYLDHLDYLAFSCIILHFLVLLDLQEIWKQTSYLPFFLHIDLEKNGINFDKTP